MTVAAKYPIRIGKSIVPKGSVGEVVSMTPRILESFPALNFTEDGQLLLVKFPDLDECLVEKKQLMNHEQNLSSIL